MYSYREITIPITIYIYEDWSYSFETVLICLFYKYIGIYLDNVTLTIVHIANDKI